MLTKTQEQILAYLLKNPKDHVTIRGISKKLNKSYTLVYNNIAKLEKNEIIIKENIPPAKIVKLNEFAPPEILVGIELKIREEFLEKHHWIKVMLEDFFSSTKTTFFILIVFGSYAKGTQTAESDLDLLIILKNKKEIMEIENAINRAYTKVKKGLNFVDANDFKDMIINPNQFNIGNEAKNNHIILHGVEIYYQLLRSINK